MVFTENYLDGPISKVATLFMSHVLKYLYLSGYAISDNSGPCSLNARAGWALEPWAGIP